jgi:pimeloyl-ACP methyl ester carboxylesterase
MSKPELYIIHGWTYTVEPWKRTLELLKNAGINVKMLHVPGLTEESNKVYTIDDYVKWADENIPDGAIALGHSNGGRILLNLSIKKPGKLSNLILLDAAGIYEVTKKKKPWQHLLNSVNHSRKSKSLIKHFTVSRVRPIIHEHQKI